MIFREEWSFGFGERLQKKQIAKKIQISVPYKLLFKHLDTDTPPPPPHRGLRVKM
jgi:hypothetical protein